MHGYVSRLRPTLSHSSITMLFLLLLFSALALAAPFDLPLDPDTFKNLTATNRCSTTQDWQAYAFLVEDCFAAIQRLYIEEIVRKPDETWEFLARGTRHRTKKPSMRTPVQYTVSSCTLSIIMLDWFASRATLPGRASGGDELSDVASFREIYNAARVVEKDCLLPSRQPGWDAVGRESSIGVFLWATDSSINDQITGRDKSLLPLNLISPNTSNMAADSTE